MTNIEELVSEQKKAIAELKKAKRKYDDTLQAMGQAEEYMKRARLAVISATENLNNFINGKYTTSTMDAIKPTEEESTDRGMQ